MESVVVGESTAVMESSRLQRRPNGSTVIGVRQSILFHEISREMLVNENPGKVGLVR